MSLRKRVFFVSDRTGITVEALGSSLLSQFADMPFLRRFHGQAGVQEFFKVLAEVHDITSFTPQEFYADADKVFVIGCYSWTMKPSGRAGSSDWLHVWTIRNGKVAGMRSLNDTALLAEAWRG